MSLPAPHPVPWPLEQSSRLLDRAKNRIPGLTLSMMKKPEHFAEGNFPVYLQRGKGAVVWDVDGNEYVDFICGLGANSLGHHHDAVHGALLEALEDGILHSLPHELELSVADALVEAVPNAEMVRFFKTGADATSAAIRLARAVTRRDRIVTIGYNGWHDHFMFDTPGVPQVLSELTCRLPLFAPEDEQRVFEHLDESGAGTAAVLLSLPYNRIIRREFLLELRSRCTAQGIQLIFDEIVTGFRLARGGAQEFFDVEPDYSCYSKAIAAGMPLSAVAGPRKPLEQMDQLQVSTTFGGELLSLAAALACLRTFEEDGVIAHISELGRQLREGINEVAARNESPLRVVGYDAIPFFLFDRDPRRHVERMRVFQGHMAKRGVLLRRDVNFICAAHTERQIRFTIDVADECLQAMGRD